MAESRIYRVSGIRLRSTIALPELPRAQGQRADCTVEVSSAIARTDGLEWFHRWSLKPGRTWLRFGRGDDRYVVRFPGLVDFDVSPSGRRIVAHVTRALPAATLRHLLLDQVVPLALGRMGRMAIHASAVQVPGVGVIAFAGGSGSGKSTLVATLARDGCAVLTDDCLVITMRGNSAWAIPSYGGVRLWPDAAVRLGYRGRRVAHFSRKVRVGPARLLSGDRPARLRALFLLAPPSAAVRDVRVSARGPRDRFIGLVRSAYLLDIADRAALARLFHEIGVVSERVPIAGLRLAKDRRRLPELARQVRELAGRLANAVSC
jgi:hypothetical protein